jgi:hypothetical protein
MSSTLPHAIESIHSGESFVICAHGAPAPPRGGGGVGGAGGVGGGGGVGVGGGGGGDGGGSNGGGGIGGIGGIGGSGGARGVKSGGGALGGSKSGLFAHDCMHCVCKNGEQLWQFELVTTEYAPY